MQPLFLDLERVLRTHPSLIEHYGGAAGSPAQFFRIGRGRLK
jgi:hypothetical protein